MNHPFGSWAVLIDPFEQHRAKAYADICRACLESPTWDSWSHPLPALHAIRLASFAGRATDPFTGDAQAFLHDLDVLADEVRAAGVRGLVQFTEPLRVADVLPGLLLASQWGGGRPLRVVELGCSVGFLLVPDRFRIHYPRATWNPADAMCDLASDLDVPPGLLEQPLTIAERVGVDLAPVDASAPEAYDYLRAFAWPGDPSREQRLFDAMATVRHDPPPMLRADVLHALTDLVQADRQVVTVVVESALAPYLSGPQTMRLSRTLDRLAGRTHLMFLTRGRQRDETALTSTMMLVDMTHRRRVVYAMADMLSERSQWIAP